MTTWTQVEKSGGGAIPGYDVSDTSAAIIINGVWAFFIAGTGDLVRFTPSTAALDLLTSNSSPSTNDTSFVQVLGGVVVYGHKTSSTEYLISTLSGDTLTTVKTITTTSTLTPFFLNGDESALVFGYFGDGTPNMLYSTNGSTWTETLTFDDEGTHGITRTDWWTQTTATLIQDRANLYMQFRKNSDPGGDSYVYKLDGGQWKYQTAAGSWGNFTQKLRIVNQDVFWRLNGTTWQYSYNLADWTDNPTAGTKPCQSVNMAYTFGSSYDAGTDDHTAYLWSTGSNTWATADGTVFNYISEKYFFSAARYNDGTVYLMVDNGTNSASVHSRSATLSGTDYPRGVASTVLTHSAGGIPGLIKAA